MTVLLRASAHVALICRGLVNDKLSSLSFSFIFRKNVYVT